MDHTADAQLLQRLHDQHARALRTFVLGLTGGDEARTQDVVQETLVRAWRTPAVLAQADGSARPWLYTVARRILIDEWRSARARSERLVGDLPERPTDDGVAALATRQVVFAAMRSLSVDHRAVLYECYFRGSTVEEAARALDVPPGTVKSRTHYALRALRLALEESGGLS